MKTIACLDAEALAALLEAEATKDLADYSDHLETCVSCQQTIAELADGRASWEELTHCLPHLDDSVSDTSPALNRVMVQLKNDLSLLAGTAIDDDAEPDFSLSLLTAPDRPGLLGYLGGYEVQEVIGRGGMGVVFKAFDPALNRLVAIKVMAAYVAGSATARRRFIREAQAAAAVCHEHIVTVHGVHEADGLPYLVMQYVAGESLQARLDRTGPLEVSEIVRLGLQTALGLAAAHEQGLIHRDIKPANLLLENGLARVRITDFGLARTVDDVQLTQHGAVAGTPQYMAPEQARGETVDHRADLFSLGSVLYALCTGKPPFHGSTALGVLRQVNEEVPPSIRSLNPKIPVWLETLIVRLMAKDPAERFQSAAEVAALLEGYLTHLRQPATIAAPELPASPVVVQTRKPTKRPRMTPRKWLLAAGAVVLLLGFLGVRAASLLSSHNPVALGGGMTPKEPKFLEPKDGLLCVLVNKKSGRCLSIGDKSATPGARIVQGPLLEQAGATERWKLRGTGTTFRLLNEYSHLALEIGSANLDPGVQAIQWHDQPPKTNQLWKFERSEDAYRLRAMHSRYVLCIGEGSGEEGAAAIQWEELVDQPDQLWELRPVTSSSGGATQARPLQEHVWVFKGEPANSQLLQFVGPESEDCVHYEPNGLHIKLPAEHEGKRVGTGLGTTFDIQGDFEITMSYAILKEPEPKDTGLGTGVFLAVDLNTPSYTRVSLTRGTRQGQGFTTWYERPMAGADKLQSEMHHFPTTAKTGRLRLVRVGPLVSHYAAEEASDEFTLLDQHLFGEEDVKTVRIGGQTGGPQAELDARITELRIRAGSLQGASDTTTWPQTDGKGWLVAVGLLGLGSSVVVLSGLGVWLYVRHGRRAAPLFASAATSDVPVPAATAPPVSFQCSACGKTLRAKAELAGKKVKCSQCARAVVVPGPLGMP